MGDEQSTLSWDQLLPTIEQAIFDSLTSKRVKTLVNVQVLASSNQIPSDDLNKVLLILLKTYNYYQDLKSRSELLKTLEVFTKLDSNYISVIFKFIDLQTEKHVLPITDYLSLLAWVHKFLPSVQDLALAIRPHAAILTKAIEQSYTDSNSSQHSQHRRRIYDSILSSSKSALVEAITIDNLSIFIENALKLPNDYALIYLGALTNAVQAMTPILELPLKSDILKFFGDNVLLTKTAPKVCALELFGQFISTYLTVEDFKLLLPTIEKSVLRSSEISFGTILPIIIKHFRGPIGDDIVNSKLLASSFTGIKSSKGNVKNGAIETLKSISVHITDSNAEKFIDELFKTLKSTSNNEVKALIVSSLTLLDLSVDLSKKVLDQLLPLVSKDQNEVSLQALVKPFIKLTFNVQDNSKYIDQIKAGFVDKKIPLRRIWFVEFGEVSYNSEINVVKDLFTMFKTALEEAQQLPLPTVTNRGISSAYVAIALAEKYNIEIDYSVSLNDNGEKPSILTNSKVFTKLTYEDEMTWFMRALAASASPDVPDSYVNAWLYLTISKLVPYKSRLAALHFLETISNKFNDLTTLFVDKIVDAFSVESDELRYNFKFLSPVLSILTQITDTEIATANLVKLLVVANHESIPVKNGWVGLVQRSGHKIDVGDLVERNYQSILENIYPRLSTTKNSQLYSAFIKAVGVLNFIKPEKVAPVIVEYITNDIDISKLQNYDTESFKIWKAEEGEVVVDVLNQGKKVEDKNSKDYETKKWEEELKSELAKKKAPQKKLTKEEQILVNTQLAKESAIRQEIQTVVDEMSRSINIITEITNNATQVDNGSSVWYPVAISKLLELARDNLSFCFFGTLPIDAFINLSNLLSHKLGLLKEFVGVATLRIYGVKGIPENYFEEPILSLVGRLLFRIKILADSSPLDSLSLSYILPLLIKVLENGKAIAIKNSSKQAVTSEFVEEDPEEEQLLLAIEIIATHSEAFEDETIPRVEILDVLISLMKLPSKAKLSKECFLSMCRYIAVSPTKSDLDVILSSIVTPEQFVRTAILEGIDSEFDLSEELTYCNELWIAAHDNDLNSAEIAATIWGDNDFKVADDAPTQLLNFFGNKDSGLRLSIAKATVAAIKTLGNVTEQFLTELISYYHVKKNPPPAKLDKYGLPIKSSTDNKDTWEERSTVALTLKLMTPILSESNIEQIFKFLVEEKALSDKEDLVRRELLDAGVEILTAHGAACIEKLIPIFEESLSAKDDGTKAQDHLKECVIILYGALARHLSTSDERLLKVVDRLMKTLDTPSEDVQFAVSECIAPLVSKLPSDLSKYFDALFDKLFNGKNLAIRRGAAFGISGLVKGAGIKVLSEYDIIRTLNDAADDKKNPQRREGVSFAFECLSMSLGKYFEPYVIEVLPILLKSLGDSVPEVREATDMAARQIMKNTTSFGVKKLIPVAISNLDEIAWRSKKGSVELLGSMAYLDPTQLSASLSTIVPEIVGVLNDTHKEVRKAADQSLKRFGEVIRNPEIQAIVPTLINAIGDPTKHTDEALEQLIKTQFVHYIDGPSLALIIHVIHRGMKERSAATKKKACQIVGNMAILVDAKDLQPYLSELVAELEEAMVDPVPATRSTAARALGSLVENLGEEKFPDLIPRLLSTLQDETKTGDRLGSAQALSEVICGLGINKLEELFPGILANAVSPRNYIRAGYMPLLLFLPVCFGSQFAPYLSRIIPPILNGLADVDEDIRDVALRAGRLIVKNYAKKAVDLLLPELEKGLSDENYRIRLSSVELTGDLLFQITGISGKNELNEDQADYSGEVTSSLIEVLGQERRARILASLFVCRSDTAGIVRQAAVDIWKALVANTPKTVKEIIPSLTSIVIRRLASPDADQRTIAAQTLGEMVRRVGGNALQQILPTLEESMQTNDNDAKQGICIALTELIKSTQPDVLQSYQDVFIKIIREALADSAPKVREAAAQAFEALQDELGKVVIDEIIPHLLNMLESNDSEHALLALQDIMAKKSDVIFPILIPTLLTPPIDAFKANALSSLASVAGSALYRRLSLIINTLIDAVIESKSEDEQSQEDIKTAFDNILLAIDDDDGVNPLMQQLLSLVKHEDIEKRGVIYRRLGNFFANTNLDISNYLQDVVERLVLSLGDKSEDVVKGSFEALTALIKRQPKEQLEKLVKPTFHALELSGVRGEDLPAFTLPRGPNAVLPIFSHGLMYGNAEQKELSALAIADIIDKTPAEILKPFATTITGPLIRVIGEKVNSSIKAGILIALNNLLVKIPQFLRPFIPQLQRTFVRSLADVSNDTLRARAVKALGTLIKFQPRVDSLVTELVSGAKSATDQSVKTSMLKAMLEVVDKAGSNMNEASKTSILTLVEDEITVVDDKSAVAYARLIGAIAKILSKPEAAEIIKTKILSKSGNSDDKFCILSINSFLRYSPAHIFQDGLLTEVVGFVINCSNSSDVYISDNATLAIGKLLLLNGETKSPALKDDAESETAFQLDDETLENLCNQLALTSVKPISNSPDTRRLSLVVIRTVARLKNDVISKHLDSLVPSVFVCIRDPIIPIKLAAEKAYLSIFNLVEDIELTQFNNWFADKTEFTTVIGTKIVSRSIGDYTKRVATRLAGVERDRIEAGGDAETMFSDRFEDETEIWAVGGIELNKF